MNKKEFLEQLQKELAGLPPKELEERLAFYGEMIDDQMEEGRSEEEAVSNMGTVQGVAEQIIAEVPLSKLVKEKVKVKPKRGLRPLEIVLLILGAPIWLSLLIALFAIALSLYCALWSVIISLWAVAGSLAACVLGGVVSAVMLAIGGQGLSALAMLAGGMACAGLSILFFFGCKQLTMGMVWLTKKMIFGIKSLFVRKERAK